MDVEQYPVHIQFTLLPLTISVAKNSQFLYNDHTRQHEMIEETPPAPLTPSSPTALTSEEEDDENEDELDHKDVDSDECDRNISTEVEDNSNEGNIGYQKQE